MRAKMSKVELALRGATYGDPSACTPEKCHITVDSDDEIGEAAASFNRLVEALSASQTVAQVARRFATTLSSHIELTPLVDAALADLCAASSCSAGALCIVRDGDLVTIASTGVADAESLAMSDLVARAYRTLDVVKVDLPDDVRLDGGLVTFKPRSVVAYPLHTRLVPIGVLVMASNETIAADDDYLVGQLLPNFAVALNNALAHERLQKVAAIDTLTGLYNRRFGLERLSQDFSRSVRSKEPLGVILFDIDHFKAVNDTHGHHTGDEVLRMVAQSVKRVLREGDTLMRYGGEEFLAVLPAAGEDDVRDMGERIRRVVEESHTVAGVVEVRVTISLGAISFPHVDATDLDDLIRRTDAAMYQAKNAGRNRLAFA